MPPSHEYCTLEEPASWQNSTGIATHWEPIWEMSPAVPQDLSSHFAIEAPSETRGKRSKNINIKSVRHHQSPRVKKGIKKVTHIFPKRSRSPLLGNMRDDPDGRRGSGKRKQTPSSLPFLEPVLTRQRERGSSAANSDPKPLPSDFSFDDLGIEELGTMFSSLGSGGGGAGGSLGSGGAFAGFSPRMAMSPLTGEAGGSTAASAVDEKRSSGEQQQAIIPLMRRDSAEEARSMVRAAADRGSVASSLVSSSAACADATSTAPQRSSASSSSSTASAAAMARAGGAAVSPAAAPRPPLRSPGSGPSASVVAAAAAAAAALRAGGIEALAESTAGDDDGGGGGEFFYLTVLYD